MWANVFVSALTFVFSSDKKITRKFLTSGRIRDTETATSLHALRQHPAFSTPWHSTGWLGFREKGAEFKLLELCCRILIPGQFVGVTFVSRRVGGWRRAGCGSWSRVSCKRRVGEEGNVWLWRKTTRFVGSGLAFPPICDVCLQKRALIIL